MLKKSVEFKTSSQHIGVAYLQKPVLKYLVRKPEIQYIIKMVPRVFNFVVLIVVLGLLAVNVAADSSYRKPPFNGSIFGKRSNSGNAISNNNNNNGNI